jgi:hypothetical protein
MRLKAVLAELTSYATKNTDQLPANKRRMMWVLKRVAADVVEELDEVEPAVMSAYFNYMGSVISWIGHGDDEHLPNEVKEFLQARTGTEPVEDGINTELSGANTHAG